jgi:hypothetical protein
MRLNIAHALSLSASCLLALGVATRDARADTVYQLDCDTAECSPSLDFGTVTLHQDGSAVDVSVVLNSALGVHFAPTELFHPAFTWTMAGDPSDPPDSFGELSPGFMSMSMPTFNDEVAYFVRCAACDAGTANPSALSFSIADHSINDFMPNFGGFFFTANIVSDVLDAQGAPFIGRVGSRLGLDPVPEPTFYVALAFGVGALFFTARRRVSSKQG